MQCFRNNCERCGKAASITCHKCFKSHWCSAKCQNAVSKTHDIGCYTIDPATLMNPLNKAYLEAFDYNLFRENKAIRYYETRNCHDTSPNGVFNQMRGLIYNMLVNMILNDPVSGKSASLASKEANVVILRMAGRTLLDSGGLRDMNDLLLWSFIPPRFHSMIREVWNSIVKEVEEEEEEEDGEDEEDEDGEDEEDEDGEDEEDEDKDKD